MATITIPKHITKGEELVVLTRKEYEKAFSAASRREGMHRASLVEQVRRGAIARASRDLAFVERWAGKFRVARGAAGDARFQALKARYGLAAR